MIKNITITNIGAFEKATAYFQKGKTAIVGENGAGKTTVLKCIYMGLTGDSKYILGTNIDDFIRRGNDSGSVEIVFEIDGNDYTVKRNWQRSGRNTASLKTPTGKITGINAVTLEMEKIFRLPTKMLLDITWARQGSIAELLEGDKDVFDRLLGISDLENAWNRLRTIQTEIKSEIKTEESFINNLSKIISNKEEVAKKIEDIRNSIMEKTAEKESIMFTSEKKDYTEKLMSLISKRSKIELKCAQINNLPQKGGKCPTCGQEITEVHREKLQEENESNIQMLKTIDGKLDKFKKLQEEHTNEQEENREKELQIAKLESAIESEQQLLTELEDNMERINEISKELAEREAILERLNKELLLSETMRNSYRGAQPYLRSGRINKLKYGVLSVFEEMFGDRFSYFDIDENYKMSVWEEDYQRSAKTLSGGEGIALAIALRLSIVSEIGNQDLLILDEPTNHLDPDRIRQLIGVLDTITTDDQIFLVTHNDLITSVSDHAIVIKKGLTSSSIEED